MKLRYTAPNGNEVTLSNVKLAGFSVDNVYEGDAFNRAVRKESITGTAIISGNPFTSSTGSIDSIRNTLNHPRGKLELAFEDQTPTYYTLADGRETASVTTAADARNGPLPMVSISRIEGATSNAVTFVSFSYSWFNCGDTRIQAFQMTVSQTLDEAGFITMTRSGFLKVSQKYSAAATSTIATDPNPLTIPNVPSLSADPGSSPDLYRNLVAGRPPEFFRRVRQDYTLDASLTTLGFTIEDRMVFRELKYPVMLGDASFTYERSLGSASFLGTKTFNAQFEGGPTTPPQDLLKVAIEAAASRIDFQNDLIQSIAIREPNIYSRNKIDLTVVALGQSTDTVDVGLVRDMFSDPHTAGVTKYVSAYGSGGVYISSTSGLKWDPCQAPAIIESILRNNPASGDTDSSLRIKPTADDAPLQKPSGDSVTQPASKDPGVTNTDNRIKHLDGTQDIDTQDSGMRMIEATGGAFQWPLQVRMPVVVITQTVRYVSNTQSAPVPYPAVGDPFIVLNEKISINNAPPDATGKPVFAVVATRQIQVQTSASTNTLFGETGVPRRVWSPSSVQQSRGLYTSNNAFSAKQVNSEGVESRSDYV